MILFTYIIKELSTASATNNEEGELFGHCQIFAKMHGRLLL